MKKAAFFSWVVGLALVSLPGWMLADPITNSLTFSDDFESYTNNTPLVDGTNGWYGSSSNIIVLSNTVIAYSSTNCAKVPVDCILSNRFLSEESTNVWMQLDMRAELYDGLSSPAVNTNKGVIFYINSNGNVVAHNGAASPTPTNSANWVIITTNLPVISTSITNIVQTIAQGGNPTNQGFGIWNG